MRLSRHHRGSGMTQQPTQPYTVHVHFLKLYTKYTAALKCPEFDVRIHGI